MAVKQEWSAEVPNVNLVVRVATTFTTSGDLDEEAFAPYLERFISAGLVVYVASGGSGQGCALTFDELRRVYEIGVEACRGRVTVGANIPDQVTAKEATEHARFAAGFGVDHVQIYGPSQAHGYKANGTEYLAYFDQVLGEITTPVALSPNPTVCYAAPAVIAQICNKYPQVIGVNLTGIYDDLYPINLSDRLDRDVFINADWIGSLNTLGVGATGLHASQANFLPQTFRRYLDAYNSGDMTELHRVYAQLRRGAQYISQWGASSPRVHKMIMKAFRLPGGDGGVRPPFVELDDAELERFVAGALELDIPEINDMARAAGR
jgi:dihydrodipicolinate synthase/N-acetylneuraminate lyase